MPTLGGYQVGEAFINIRPDMTGFSSELSSSVKDHLGQAVEDLGDSFKEFGSGLLKKFALPIGVALAANITQFQALDAKIRETLTLLGGSSSDIFNKRFEEMQEGIRGLSEEVGVLEQGISEGLYQALSAGIPRNTVFDFLEVAQKAAIAGGIDLLTAVDGLTTAVNAFESEGLTATEAADIMFKTVARGKTTFDELSRDMAKVAPLVAATGTSFAEFQAIIATMTLSGTRTSEAFTGVRAALTGMLRPGEEMNQIWGDMGFASGDAAIAALGLQGAMAGVAEATDNEVSALIKLLGGAEAANAVLQVTGEQQGRFESVIKSTTNATGAATDAFDIMQEGTGRAFGQMTAAFDRLGNAGGDLADNFVVPVVRAVTGAVTTLANFTSSLGNFIEPLGDAWSGLVQTITGNRVFKTLVTVTAALYVSFASLATVVGALTLGIGALIAGLSWFLQRTLLNRLDLLQKSFVLVGTKAAELGARLSASAIPAFEKLSGYLVRSGEGLKRFSTLLRPGPVLGFTAVVVGLGWAWKTLNDRSNDVIESYKGMTLGADRLNDSLGGVVEKIQAVNDEGDIQSSVLFKIENADLIDEIQDVQERFGASAVQDKLFQLTYRFVQTGDSPTEAIDLVQAFIDAADLDVEITFTADDLTGENAADSILKNFQNDLDQILATGATRISQKAWYNVGSLLDEGASQAIGTLEEYAETAVGLIFTEGDVEAGLEVLRGINALLGDDIRLVDEFNDRFVAAFNEASDGDILSGIFGDGERVPGSGRIITTLRLVEEAIAEFLPKAEEAQELVAGFYQDTFSGEIKPYPTIDLSGVEESLLSLRDRSISEFLEEEAEAWEAIIPRMSDAWTEASNDVIAAQDAIMESFLDQMPLLDIYSGAVDQSYQDWKDSQDQFQADLQTWVDKLAVIEAKLPEDITERLKNLPLNKQVWLASLKDTEFEEAIDELTETWSGLSAAGKDEIEKNLPDILASAALKFQTTYDEMEGDALDAGHNVAREFYLRFESQSLLWEAAATARAGNLNAILASIGGPPPSLTTPQTVYEQFRFQEWQREGIPEGFGGGGGFYMNGDINIDNAEPQTDEQSVEQAVYNQALLRGLSGDY